MYEVIVPFFLLRIHGSYNEPTNCPRGGFELYDLFRVCSRYMHTFRAQISGDRGISVGYWEVVSYILLDQHDESTYHAR